MAATHVVRLDRVLEELAAVNAKLDDGDAGAAGRLQLLRRQAALGDLRDAVRDAERRRALPPR